MHMHGCLNTHNRKIVSYILSLFILPTRDQILDKAFLSWEDVSGRIHQLLKQGEYAPQSVLDIARENTVKEHAQVLAYMKADMAEGVAELVFAEEDLPHLRRSGSVQCQG